ncbi:uncharacterized protein [Garra rufa]|uniref:uncharacterized protein n=1 Tax=Garra rufa TaxID=137080 RepID=UPI003CCE5E92
MPNKKKQKETVKFYSEPVEELYTGYLIKSPTRPALPKNTKSWKRRFFVLSKTRDTYQLTYHAKHESIDKPLRVIDISKISLLFTSPETHQKWDWVKKKFKCSPSSVLFMKVEEDTLKHSRDYFLIGENSDDVEGWCSALVNVQKTQNSQNKLQHKANTLQDDRFRSASEALRLNFSEDNDRNYCYPHKLSEPPLPIPVIEEKDEKDEMQDESPEDSSEYMASL